MAIPVTAHPAFDKAAEYFGIRVTHVPVDPLTNKVDINEMKRSITSNTIMIVGSCPSYPWGIIDDVDELGRLATYYNVGLHVDCCLGGFLVAFMEDSGFSLRILFYFYSSFYSFAFY
jgi:sphinganine-1-phosphate aldolase